LIDETQKQQPEQIDPRTKLFEWSCNLVRNTGIFMGVLLSLTYIVVHLCPEAQSGVAWSDAFILFFAAVMFIGSLCFAWNVHRE